MSIAAQFRMQRGEFSLACDFVLPGTGISALFGPSGCGKTTLLRAIAGLDYYPGGFLRNGKQTWQDKQTFLPAWKRPIGYVFQEASLFPHLNTLQNIEYGYRRVPEAERLIKLEQVVEWLGLDDLLQRRPEHLSGGERQRVAIARALAVSPKLLLMDEPLSSLDARKKAEVMPYLEELHRLLELPVVYVTHSMEEVTRLADHLVLLEAGKVVAAGALADLLTRLDLPLAGGVDASAVLEGRVESEDAEFHLTTLSTPCGSFSIAHDGLQPGSQVRLQIAARDVSLTLEPQQNTSILNIIPARIEGLVNESPAQVVVRLRAGQSTLLSRVTRKSATELDLQIDKPVYAQVKSIALLR